MARKPNFDDSQLQAALVNLTREFPRDAMAGMAHAAKFYVEKAKQKTKLASKPRIKREKRSGRLYGVVKDELGAGATEEQVELAVDKELQSRLRAIGYQRGGWKIARISKRIIEIWNIANNSKFVKNTVRAGKTAVRETKKVIPELAVKQMQPTAKKYSARR